MSASKEKFKLNDVSSKKIKKWFSKWDRTIAAITGVVIFCAVLIVVIVNVKAADGSNEDEDEDEKRNVQSGLISKESPHFVPQRIMAGSNCNKLTDRTVTIVNASVANLCQEIITCIEGVDTMYFNQLRLVVFDRELAEGWLDCDLPFTDLIIESSTLNKIDENAFQGATFTKLKRLNLNTSVQEFRREMFVGLYLKTLQIICQSTADFDENVLGAIALSLVSLQITNCIVQKSNPILPKILGASEELNNLKELDIQFNTFKTVTADSFKSATLLQSIYMSGCKIKEIEAGTFNDMESIITLDLSSNALETLPERLFSSVKGGIIIIGNDFVCDCNLVWLKDLVETWGVALFNPPEFFCAPYHQLYKDVTFCSNGTTPDDETTTPGIPTTELPTEETTELPTEMTTEPIDGPTGSTTEVSTTTEDNSDTTSSSTSEISTTTTWSTSTVPSTTPSSDLREIRCRPAEQELLDEDLDSTVVSLVVREGTIIMDFTIRDDDVYITIRGSSSEDKTNVLWFDSDDKTTTGCISHVSLNSTTIVPKPPPGKIFVFCLMSSTQETISPFDCGAFKVPEERTTWLDKDDMIPLISGVAGSLLLVAVITSLIVFYCIRQNPSLIKGNKRVIIVESEAADAIIMPSYYSEPHYRPPTLSSRSNGYLTPKHHVVYHYPTPRSHLRTISEHTDFVVPSTSTGGRYKKGHYKRRTKLEHKCYDDNVYESPPPLPPNHPSGSVYGEGCRSCSHV